MKERKPGGKGTHILLVGICIVTVTIKDSLQMPEKKKNKRAKPSI